MIQEFEQHLSCVLQVLTCNLASPRTGEICSSWGKWQIHTVPPCTAHQWGWTSSSRRFFRTSVVWWRRGGLATAEFPEYDEYYDYINYHKMNVLFTCTKYMRMYPRLSMSSLLLCSMPRWVLMLAYRAVPAWRKLVKTKDWSQCQCQDWKLCFNCRRLLARTTLLSSFHNALQTCQILVFSVGNMLMCSGISVLLGKTEVNDVDQIAFLSQTPAIEKYINENFTLPNLTIGLTLGSCQAWCPCGWSSCCGCTLSGWSAGLLATEPSLN